MARDYAARNPKQSGNRRPAQKKKSGGLPGWVLMLAGLSMGLVVAVFVYVSRPTQQPLRGTSAASDRPPRVKDKANTQAAAEDEDANVKPGTKPPPRTASAAKDDDAAKVEVPPKEKSRFTFYELLPSQEVLVPSQPAGKPSAAPPPPLPAQPPPATATATPGTEPASVPASVPPTTAPSAATSGSFIIQVASYRGQPEAEKQKAALALIGMESRIEKVTIDNRDTYYRVRIGPLRDENRARDTLAQLESNGIKAVMVKVK
jgi:cell division septation protein DedD